VKKKHLPLTSWGFSGSFPFPCLQVTHWTGVVFLLGLENNYQVYFWDKIINSSYGVDSRVMLWDIVEETNDKKLTIPKEEEEEEDVPQGDLDPLLEFDFTHI